MRTQCNIKTVASPLSLFHRNSSHISNRLQGSQINFIRRNKKFISCFADSIVQVVLLSTA